jgi:hypothetical protein
MLHYVVWWIFNDVLEMPVASIIMVMIHCLDDGGSKHF